MAEEVSGQNGQLPPGRVEELDVGPPGLVAKDVLTHAHALQHGQLRAWALTMFERMLAHPWAHELAQGIRPVGPNEVGWMESALTTVVGSGLTGAESLDTIALLASHVRGLALQATAAGDENLEAALGRQLSEALGTQAGRPPHGCSIRRIRPTRRPGQRPPLRYRPHSGWVGRTGRRPHGLTRRSARLND